MDEVVHAGLTLDAVPDDAATHADHGNLMGRIRRRERGEEVDAAGAASVDAVGLDAIRAADVGLRGQPALDVLTRPRPVLRIVPVDGRELTG